MLIRLLHNKSANTQWFDIDAHDLFLGVLRIGLSREGAIVWRQRMFQATNSSGKVELIGLVRIIRLQEGNLLNFDEVYRQYLCISLTRTYIESFILGFGALISSSQQGTEVISPKTRFYRVSVSQFLCIPWLL